MWKFSFFFIFIFIIIPFCQRKWRQLVEILAMREAQWFFERNSNSRACFCEWLRRDSHVYAPSCRTWKSQLISRWRICCKDVCVYVYVCACACDHSYWYVLWEGRTLATHALYSFSIFFYLSLSLHLRRSDCVGASSLYATRAASALRFTLAVWFSKEN